MEEYIINNCEAEGHIDHFHDRKVIWDMLKLSILNETCKKITIKFKDITKCVSKNSDKQLEKQMKWTEFLTDMVCDPEFGMDELVNSCPDGLHHCCCLMQTVGKYAFVYLSREGTVGKTSQTDLPVWQQSDSGLLVLGSGCVGQMFRLYKKNRPKYQHLMKPLVNMIVRKKQSVFVPVEQTSRDRGGLYVIRTDFLPLLRILDSCMRQTFAKVSQHGYNIVKEVTKKVKSLSHVTDAFLCQFPRDADEHSTRTVVDTFIRKYTNARIGGFVKGGAERHAEKKGQRFKGGGTLREKLTHVTGAKGTKSSKIRPKGKKTNLSKEKTRNTPKPVKKPSKSALKPETPKPEMSGRRRKTQT